MLRFNQSTEQPHSVPRVNGRWWLDDSGRQIDHSRISNDRHARKRAFNGLGMIEITSNRHFVCLRWYVSQVSPMAMMAAAHFVATRMPGTQINLEYFWGAWNREMIMSAAQAIARLTTLASFQRVIPFRQTKRLARSFTSIFDNEGPLLASAFREWERNEAATSITAIEKFTPLMKFSLIFRYDEKRDELFFGHIGNYSGAMQVFGSTWAATALGRRCDRSQPDFEYDSRACHAYRDVLHQGKPVLDHVRAIIRLDGKDPIWVPYRRLVLPARDRFGAPVIMSICEIDQDLAIPFMAA